jgi:hypothetical protein
MNDRADRAGIFNEYRHEIWGGLRQCLDEERGSWTGRPLRVHHGPFVVVLDLHAEAAGYSSHVVTRLRAPYINRDGFRFRIRRRSWVQTLAKILGAQDIETGHEAFDREFTLQANSAEELRQLLTDDAIREQLAASSMSVVEVRDDEGIFGPGFPGAVDELYMAAEGRIVEPDRIEALYELFADILNRLCHIGSAYRDDPKLEL